MATLTSAHAKAIAGSDNFTASNCSNTSVKQPPPINSMTT